MEELSVGEETGDVVNDSVYLRNAAVEERLGVNFKIVSQPGNYGNMNQFSKNITASVLAGSGEYDLIASYNLIAPTFILNGILRNLAEVDYLDFDKPWWPENIIDEMQIDGKFYLATGDASIGLFKWMYCTYFNKQMLENLGLEDPYQLVGDGKWTIDRLDAMAKNAYEDLNGDGVENQGDRYGLVVRANMQAAAFISSCDIPITSRDSDGYPVMAFGSERVVSVVQRLYELFNTNPGYIVGLPNSDNDETTFAAGNALFYMGYLGYSSVLRDVDDFDFGIVPAARLDENQEDYKIYVGNEYTFYSLPVDAKAPSMTGAVLEAFASEAYRTTTPAYYETALKIKYSRDDASAQMLDMMKANIDFNFGYIYANNIGDNPAAQFRYAVRDGKSDCASTYASREAKYSADLETIVETYPLP